MNLVRIARVGMAVALATLLGCGGGPYSLSWEVRTGGLMPTAIRLEIVRGGCDATDVVWSEDQTPTLTSSGTPPTLEAGTYCLRARAVDESCELVGWAQEEVVLPRRDSAPVVLTLGRDASMSVPPICATRPCTDPLCSATLSDAGPLDGGPRDGGRLDAGMGDAAMSDVGLLDAGIDTGMGIPMDTGTDARIDDAGMDTSPPDAGVDAGLRDSGNDAGRDARPADDAFRPPDATGCAHGATTSGAGPIGIRPWSGWTTGSVPSATIDTTFEWSAVSGATCYELQLSDSCVAGALDTCSFTGASLEVSSGTTLVLPLDASSSGGGIAGRRWTWRVRGCTASGCTMWGSPRYLDVGRSRSDLDGDGTPDLVEVGPHTDDNTLGLIAVLRGRTPELNVALTLPNLAAGVTALGQGLTTCDIDGDGFHEIIAAAPTTSYLGRATAGRVYVFAGPPSAGATPVVILGQGAAGAQMGASVACGDVDNDGFADVIIGGPGGAGRVEVHLGGSAPLLVDDGGTLLSHGSASGSSRFGTSLALGDVSPSAGVAADGIVDIFVGAPVDRSVYAYRGADGASPATVPFLDGTLEQPTVDTFGEALLVADFDSVLGADVVIGAPASITASTGGAVYFASLPSLSTRVLRATGVTHHGGFGARFGAALAVVRSTDASVRAELLVGAPGADSSASDLDQGATVRITGSSSGPMTVGTALFGPDGANGYFGRSVAADVLGSRGGVSRVAGEAGSGAVWPLDTGDFISPVFYDLRPFDGTAVAFGGP